VVSDLFCLEVEIPVGSRGNAPSRGALLCSLMVVYNYRLTLYISWLIVKNNRCADSLLLPIDVNVEKVYPGKTLVTHPV
jgi:hypothetical protein